MAHHDLRVPPHLSPAQLTAVSPLALGPQLLPTTPTSTPPQTAPTLLHAPSTHTCPTASPPPKSTLASPSTLVDSLDPTVLGHPLREPPQIRPGKQVWWTINLFHW